MKSTISTRGQVSIPSAIRKKHGIETESQAEWIEDGDAIRMVPLPKDPIRAFRGAGKAGFLRQTH